MVSKAAPTAAVDADRVYAFFETGDLAAFSHAGKPLWHRKLTRNSVSSTVVTASGARCACAERACSC